jgi:hypothetical protein
MVALVGARVHLCVDSRLSWGGLMGRRLAFDVSGGMDVMAVSRAELSVELQPGSDTGSEELTQIAGWLRAELLDLDVDSVQQSVQEEVPKGAKGADLLTIGQLVVGLVASPEVLASITGAVRSWLGCNRARSVKLTMGGDALEVSGVNSIEQERLIDLWVSRHAISV